MDQQTTPTTESCSFASRYLDEPMAASVKQTRAWILIEYNQPLGAKALRDARIPDRVKVRLDDLIDHLPASRLLLIRGGGVASEGIRIFCIDSCEKILKMYRFEIASYEALLDFDFEALFAGQWTPQEAELSQPLFLVCTNGRRDPCCARLGLPAYERLSRVENGNTWQTSHVGGHRFAPNLICFPHGIFYGRADTEHIEQLASDYKAGRLVPELYRGRSCYPKPAQAAEYHLRLHTGCLGLNDFQLEESVQLETDQWRVRFREASGEKSHELDLKAVKGEAELFSGCFKREDLLNPIEYQVLEYRQG